jgi:Protein of unknown function (DUF4087)
MARRRGCKRKIGADEKRLPPAVLLCAPVAAFAQNSPEKLCGSFENPTPASAWLTDRSGTWTIVVQGGHQADGDWANFAPAQKVRTNGDYGHGCACIEALVDRAFHHLDQALSAPVRRLPSRPSA